MLVTCRGAFATVYECSERSTDRQYAAKYIRIVSEDDKDGALREFEMLRGLSHPRIVKLEDAFDLNTHIVLILE